MSVEAITWALAQPITHSSAKFVLVVLANCASAENNLAYPSVAYLSDATGQNRKTVLANLRRLCDDGYISDSGERRGATKQIVVYRLRTDVQRNGDLLTERHYCYRSEDPTTGRYYIGVRTCLGEPISDAAYIGSGRWVQTLAASGVQPVKTILSVFASRVRAEDAERELIASAFNDPCCMNRVVPPKRTEKGIVSNSSGIGTVSGGVTVPKTAGNSPKNGGKQSQKRDTEPSEPSVNKEQYQQRDNDDGPATRSVRDGRRGTRLPDGWQPSEAVREWARSEFPNVDVATVLPEFADYWRSVPGHRGCKLDWDATFRNRVRYIAARQRKHHGSHRESAAERVARINAEAELREAGGLIEGDFYVN